ncbi:MAG: hypothetical protein WC621_03660 [Patescibacteria group bacterium]
MNSFKIIKYSLVQAIAATVYIALVALLMTNAHSLFGEVAGVLAGVAFLLTLVLSAAIMGITIFGRAIIWYLGGDKKEAVKLVGYTLGWLVLITLLVFLALLV